MANIDNISDSELRTRLIGYGYPVGPVTQTTRKILINKLKAFEKDNVDGKVDQNRKLNLSTFSSGEEEEDDSKQSKNRRRSTARSPMGPPKKPPARRSNSASRKATSRASVVSPVEYSSPEPAKKSPSRGRKSTYQEPSSADSSPERSSVSRKAKATNSNHWSNSVPSSSSRDAFETGSDSDLNDMEPTSSRVRSSFLNDSPSSLSRPSTLSSLPSSLRSRFLPSSNSESVSLRSSHTSPLSYKPYASEFAQRLSMGHLNSGNSSYLNVKENDEKDTAPSYSRLLNNVRSRVSDVKKLEYQNYFSKSAQNISLVILLIAVLFFGGLIIMYLNMHFKETPIANSDLTVTVCSLGGKAGVTCILETEVASSKVLLGILYQKLLERAVAVQCGHGPASPVFTFNEAFHVLKTSADLHEWNVQESLGNVKILIRDNPQLGIELSNSGMEIKEPNLPLWCSLKIAVVSSMYFVLYIVTAFVMVVVVQRLYILYKSYQEEQKKVVFKMVEDIVDLLSQQALTNPGDNFLLINHIRDQLIAPSEREKTAKTWAAAVKYIEENESRVLCDEIIVNGEMSKVWRWASHAKPSNRRKTWQGQAFETVEGSVNSQPVSLTQCLKIRHMFDPEMEVGEEWISRVEDAILEKCESVKILHMAVDRKSAEGCVYLKCASPQDAGRAHKALHGFWFDGKLVTVKFLRLERYYERFPEAINFNTPLRPSNDNKLSLQ
nr:PREDICTED: inner nuclear membrane protein Man1 isoform X1 [Bemisia tabaci]